MFYKGTVTVSMYLIGYKGKNFTLVLISIQNVLYYGPISDAWPKKFRPRQFIAPMTDCSVVQDDCTSIVPGK